MSQQPRLSGKRPPQVCDGEEECRCLLIHGVFYFYTCWPWAGGRESEDLAIGNSSIKVRQDLGGQALGSEARACPKVVLLRNQAGWANYFLDTKGHLGSSWQRTGKLGVEKGGTTGI